MEAPLAAAGLAFVLTLRATVLIMQPPQMQWSATDPIQYEHFMGRWSERLTGPFLTFAGVSPGSRVLDVGCGTGVLTKALAEAGAIATGIDASEPYLGGARQHRPHPNITYELGDIRQMPFANGAFDASVSTLVLDVLPEVEEVVSEMRRVVRRGGVVASGVHDYWGFSNFSLVWDTGAVLDDGISRLRDANKAHPLVAANRQAALWRKLGLSEVTEIPVVVDCEYPSFADYWATFTAGQGRLSTLLKQLSGGLRSKIERHVRGGYLAGSPDGPRTFPMVIRAVRGVVPG
jgi:SAM-dependent methyltransferase